MSSGINLFHPNSFILQWHITNRCNWRCRHCYQENYTEPEMSFKKMREVLAQYIALIKKWRLPPDRTRIQITGGEPFIREDFFRLLTEISKYRRLFYWTIMSNASFLTRDSVKSLKLLGINQLQVSLEGLEKTNDKIRGKGSFQKVLWAIKLLVRTKIPVRVSLTLTRQNYREIKELALILAPLGVKNLGVRRIVPIGVGSDFKKLMLEPLELWSVYREIENINKLMIKKGYRLKVVGGCENGVFNNEISGYDLMSYSYCGIIAGRILAVMPDGDVLTCRRCPIKIGNLYKKNLEEIYYSPIYERLRKQRDVHPVCHTCLNFRNCLGGAKCVNYSLTGKTTPDVQCWKLFNNLEEAIKKIRRSHKKVLSKTSL